jgi:hypothetical protein
MLISKIFGVSKDPVESYIERSDVDNRMREALEGSRQIIVYGASKQGKTALLQRHVPIRERIAVHCTPGQTTEDVYRSVLRQLSVEILAERVNESSEELAGKTGLRFSAILPFIGRADAEGQASFERSTGRQAHLRPIEFKLSLAQDVGELILQVENRPQFVVLENFHYLSSDQQATIAFDLRTFEEMGIRFIVLGVWKEANRLIQYDGDLQDRIVEIPVEPWKREEFKQVLRKGQDLMRIQFAPLIEEAILDQAHGSIAIVQELAKKICELSGYVETATVSSTPAISDMNLLQAAVTSKIEDYSSRHVRSLEAIAVGSRTRTTTDATNALNLNYYLIQVVVNSTYSELSDGMPRKTIEEKIRSLHPLASRLRSSDITGMLGRLTELQSRAKIVPPLLDYDRGIRRLRVIDSTLYFFVDNCNPDEVMAEIPEPPENIESAGDMAEVSL